MLPHIWEFGGSNLSISTLSYSFPAIHSIPNANKIDLDRYSHVWGLNVSSLPELYRINLGQYNSEPWGTEEQEYGPYSYEIIAVLKYSSIVVEM